MSSLFDSDPIGEMGERSVSADLGRAVRARDVRVAERLALLADLEREGGEEAVEARIEALEERIRQASRKVAQALRGSGR